MKFSIMRFSRVKIIATLLYSILLVEVWAQSAVNKSLAPDHILLNVTEDLTSSIAVNWRTEKFQSVSKIQIVKENSSFDVGKNYKEYVAKSEILSYKGLTHWYHSIELKDLEEESVYAYRVGNEDLWSEWINFKTLASGNNPLKFIYFGDVQSNIRSLWSRVARQSIKSVPDAQFILYTGDIVNRGNNLNEWEEWFDATNGVHQQIPIMPASGNHDHGDDDHGNYRISPYWNAQFNLPNNGVETLKESSYFVNIQNVKFVILNTELFETDDEIRSDQLAWLEKVLANNQQQWTIMIMHHPIYSTKKDRDNKELRMYVKPLIDKYNVDLVLQGHDHTYARGKDKIPMNDHTISNATYVVSVSGPKMSEVLEAEWMDKSLSFVQLFHGIEIENNQLTFTSYDLVGKVVDRFFLTKINEKNSVSE